MKMKFVWNIFKEFMKKIRPVLLIILAIVLYAFLLGLTIALFDNNKVLVLLIAMGLYLVGCFILGEINE